MNSNKIFNTHLGLGFGHSHKIYVICFQSSKSKECMASTIWENHIHVFLCRDKLANKMSNFCFSLRIVFIRFGGDIWALEASRVSFHTNCAPMQSALTKLLNSIRTPIPSQPHTLFVGFVLERKESTHPRVKNMDRRDIKSRIKWSLSFVFDSCLVIALVVSCSGSCRSWIVCYLISPVFHFSVHKFPVSFCRVFPSWKSKENHGYSFSVESISMQDLLIDSTKP